MNAGRSAIVCERIRAQVSLELDGELSELERRMLSAHLDRCDDCSDYARDLSRITDDLRSAPLEQLTHPLVVQRLRRLSFPRMQVGVAAALAIAVLGSVVQLAIPGAQPSSSGIAWKPTQFETESQGAIEMRQITADAQAFDRHKQGSARAT